jgi:hypothetical protein
VKEHFLLEIEIRRTSMRPSFIIFFSLSVYFQSLAQDDRLSFQAGTLHCFFDGSQVKAKNTSYGLQFQGKTKRQHTYSLELMHYYHTCENSYNSGLYLSGNLRNVDLNVSFLGLRPISDNFQFRFGAGPSMRISHYELDSIVLPFHLIDGDYYYAIQLKGGINGRIALEYQPVKGITLFSQLNLCHYFMVQKVLFDNPALFDQGNKIQARTFPSRFDLSLRFGVGFNF